MQNLLQEQSSEEVLAMAEKEYAIVQLDICGQVTSVGLSEGELNSVSVMRRAIQLHLCGKGADLVFNDNNGQPIFTDEGLKEAIRVGNVPLRASLCDSNIHTLEIKHDELPQMQWRMMRQQFAGLDDDNRSLTGSDTTCTEGNSTVLAKEMTVLAKEMAQQQKCVATLVNRIDFLEQALAQEKRAREMVSSQQKRDFDAKKALSNQEKEHQRDNLELLEQLAQDLLKESEERIQLAITCKSNSNLMQEKYEGLKRALHEETQSQNMVLQKVIADFTQLKDMTKTCADLEIRMHAQAGEVLSRVTEFDALPTAVYGVCAAIRRERRRQS